MHELCNNTIILNVVAQFASIGGHQGKIYDFAAVGA